MVNNILKNGILGGIVAAVVMSAMVFYMKANPGVQPNTVIGFANMSVLEKICKSTVEHIKQKHDCVS